MEIERYFLIHLWLGCVVYDDMFVFFFGLQKVLNEKVQGFSRKYLASNASFLRMVASSR